ncbi:PRA1 family protein B4, partial [Linum grandiflorum]
RDCRLLLGLASDFAHVPRGLLASRISLYLFCPTNQPLVFFGRTFIDMETLGMLVVFNTFVIFFTNVGSVLIPAVMLGAAMFVLTDCLGFLRNCSWMSRSLPPLLDSCRSLVVLLRMWLPRQLLVSDQVNDIVVRLIRYKKYEN